MSSQFPKDNNPATIGEVFPVVGGGVAAEREDVTVLQTYRVISHAGAKHRRAASSQMVDRRGGRCD